MELIYANILILLIRYTSFLKHFFKKDLIRFLLDEFKYLIYILAFLLVGAKSGFLINLLGMLILIFKFYKLNKKIVFKMMFSLLMITMIYYFNLYNNFLELIPFIIVLLKLWIKPYVKNSFLNFMMVTLLSLLWIYYALYYNLYAIILYESIDLGFTLGLIIIKKANKFNQKYI